MPIYVQDDTVVVADDKVATSADCCCAGVCCTCTGECDDTITQGDCEDNGGTWFSDQTCDDNPCDTLIKGACCDGTDCSIKTEDCCNNDGGIYQGDDTVCDPNPCGNSCICFFDGFMFTGRYLTAQMHCVGSYNQVGPGITVNWSADATTHVDPDTCEVTCTSFSGSGTSHGDSPSCDGVFTVNSCHASVCGLCSGNCAFSGIMISSAPYGTGGYLDWTVDNPICDLTCTNNSLFWDFILTITDFSDTVRQYHWFFDDGSGGGYDITTIVTLSDPCTPP